MTDKQKTKQELVQEADILRQRVAALDKSELAHKRAEEALRESGEFTRRVIESSNDCIKVLDLEGHLLLMSEGGQKLLEIDDIAPYLNTSWVDFWKGKDREAALEAISKAKKGDAGIFRGYCETAKGTPKWWEIIISPIKDADGNINRLLSVSRDITESKRAEEALQEKTYELGQRVKELNCLYTFSKLIESPDISLPEIFEGLVNIIPAGWQYPEVTCGRLVVEDQNVEAPNFNETIWKQSSPVLVDRRRVGTLEVYYLEERPECDEGPFLKGERDLIDALASRLGKTIQRKRAEEALRQRSLELQQLTESLEQRVQERTAELATTNKALRHLSTKLLSAQEDERKRIAGDLHDTLGASLAGIKFRVERALEQIGDVANTASESLKTIIPEIQETVDECRRIQMDLRPSMLDDLGLLPTLSWFFRRFRSIYSGIRIEHEIDIQEGDVPQSLKIVVFRVTQEAMNNIAKHSQADLICFSLRKKDGGLELIIRDNGRGFNLEKVSSQETTTRGLGLTSMKERAQLLGGFFNIESTEGKGTIIRASWPIEQLSF